MDDTGYGRLACVDPTPQIDAELWARLYHRCRLFEGSSPDILPHVAEQVGSPFDFVLIDGNHTYEFVRRDVEGVIPLLAEQAYILLHDGHYPDVQRALDASIAANPELTDCGMLSVEPTQFHESGKTVLYAGLRLLRFQRSAKRTEI
jgi:hypothetical protein